MQITLIPMRRDDRLSLRITGDSLEINGEVFDFSPLPDGATLPREAVTCAYLASDVERRDGTLRMSLILPHGAKAPPETLFPAPVLVSGDGDVPLPPYEIETEGHQ